MEGRDGGRESKCVTAGQLHRAAEEEEEEKRRVSFRKWLAQQWPLVAL